MVIHATGKSQAEMRKAELTEHMETLSKRAISNALKMYHDRMVVPLEFRLRALEREYEKLVPPVASDADVENAQALHVALQKGREDGLVP